MKVEQNRAVRMVLRAAALLVSSHVLAAVSVAGDLKKGQLVLTGYEGETHSVRVLDRSGALLETLQDNLTPQWQPSLLVGSYFDWYAQQLYVLNNYGDFNQFGTVFQFDRHDPHQQGTRLDLENAGMLFVHSMPARDAAGNLYFYMGGEPGDCCPWTSVIRKVSPDFVVLDDYVVLVDAWYSAAVAVSANGRFLFYVRKNGVIERYDTATHTQLAPFTVSGLRGKIGLLPPYDGTGLLVATSPQVVRLDANGNSIQTYDVAGVDGWFHAVVDPNGTSFWTIAIGQSGNPSQLYRFEIATGAVEQGPIDIGTFFARDLHVIGDPPKLRRR